MKETKQNILKMTLNPPNEPIDPVVNMLIMKCFERDPAKRFDVKGIIKFQDSLEMINFGDCVSQNTFEKILEENKKKNEVAARATYDTKFVDYTSKSLDLRNNPWFFSKAYSYTERPKNGVYPQEVDDEQAQKLSENKT